MRMHMRRWEFIWEDEDTYDKMRMHMRRWECIWGDENAYEELRMHMCRWWWLPGLSGRLAWAGRPSLRAPPGECRRWISLCGRRCPPPRSRGSAPAAPYRYSASTRSPTISKILIQNVYIYIYIYISVTQCNKSQLEDPGSNHFNCSMDSQLLWVATETTKDTKRPKMIQNQRKI